MLSTSSLILLLPVIFLLHIVKRYSTNPLRKIPAAHPLAPFTSLWISSIRYRSLENRTLKDAHDRLGPVICLGPNEVSVNCVKGGIRDVYAGGFEKGDGKGFNWYSFFSNYGGVDNMFSIASNKAHSARKRMLSNIYSKSTVTASPALLAQVSTIMYNRFLPRLASACSKDDGILNIYPVLSAATMDIVTCYIFGLKSGSNLLDNPKELDWFLDLYNSRRSYNFWPQEYPALTEFVEKWTGYELVPKWVGEANGKIEAWTMAMCESAAGIQQQDDMKVEDIPSVYQQLSVSLQKEAKQAGTESLDVSLKIASEVLDHLAAGFDTSGITLIYVIHELCLHPDIQSRLQDELRTLNPPLVSSSIPTLPDPKAVHALPLLHSVIWETLRLHSAIPGCQPRVTPPQGCRLGPEDFWVPGGVRVSASAGLLHQNEEVYEQASKWIPERWLNISNLDDEKRKDMESRWFWAFGSGGRMCVGSHIAVYQMKYIVAALYSNYTTTIVDDTGIEQIDSYTAPPGSDGLMIKLQRLDAKTKDM